MLVLSNPLEENPLWRAERVDNCLGLPGLSGPELLKTLRRHAEEVGADFRTGRVLSALRSGKEWYVSVGTDMEHAPAVVLAAGAVRGKKLPGEAELLGRGVSYCATCDGMLYRGQPVAVLGYDASAQKEAQYLEEIGCQVTYFDHPRDCVISGGDRVESGGPVPGTGGGGRLCNGGPEHGDEPSRRLRRGGLHRRAPANFQGHRRGPGGGPEGRRLFRDRYGSCAIESEAAQAVLLGGVRRKA